MFTDEQWKPVREFPDHYEVSTYGRVRRTMAYRGIQSGRIRKPAMFGKYPGYLLSISQQSFARLMHRLVADAFLGPIPEGMQVNHKDGNKLNSHVTNLEIVTNSENRMHAYRVLGVKPNRAATGPKNHNAKLDWVKVDAIRSAYASGNVSYKQLADQNQVSKVLIGQIVRHRIWREADRPPTDQRAVAPT